MKKAIIFVSLIAFLLLFGCAGTSNQPTTPPVNNETPQPAAPQNNEPVETVPSDSVPQNNVESLGKACPDSTSMLAPPSDATALENDAGFSCVGGLLKNDCQAGYLSVQTPERGTQKLEVLGKDSSGKCQFRLSYGPASQFQNQRFASRASQYIECSFTADEMNEKFGDFESGYTDVEIGFGAYYDIHDIEINMPGPNCSELKSP